MMLLSSIKARYRSIREKEKLNAIYQVTFNTDNLRSLKEVPVSALFKSAGIENLWEESKKEIGNFKIPNGSGGINPGDRKALYYLISALKPSSVLEVGTHIGASSTHIASALYKSQIKNGLQANLTSVDISDVNSDVNKPWLKYGGQYSPREMMEKLNYSSFVDFVISTSLDYAANCKKKFDFIFLDGSHEAKIVYQEIPLAVNLLNKNGIILLHDYFPLMRPLWSDRSIIPGPYLAVQRLMKEGANIAVVPLGNLPWPTKKNSNMTSLALLLKND